VSSRRIKFVIKDPQNNISAEFIHVSLWYRITYCWREHETGRQKFVKGNKK